MWGRVGVWTLLGRLTPYLAEEGRSSYRAPWAPAVWGGGCPPTGKISGNSQLSRLLTPGEDRPLWYSGFGGKRWLSSWLLSPSLASSLRSSEGIVCLLLAFALLG